MQNRNQGMERHAMRNHIISDKVIFYLKKQIMLLKSMVT